MQTQEQNQNKHGSRRSMDARRSFEAFALMREELHRVRSLNSDLLSTCRDTMLALEKWIGVETDDEIHDGMAISLDKLERVLAKATGEGEGTA